MNTAADTTTDTKANNTATTIKLVTIIKAVQLPGPKIFNKQIQCDIKQRGKRWKH